MICPWSGRKCDCGTFPFLHNDLIPQKCEKDLPWELVPIRKVSQRKKDLYKKYLEMRKKLKK